MVHRDNLFTLLAVGAGSRFLHQLDRFFGRNDLGKAEEGGLQDGVGASAQAKLFGDVGSVDGVEFNVVLGDEFLHLGRQMGVQIGRIPRAVEKEGPARLQILDHVVFIDIGGVVAGHEVGLVDQIGALDGLLAKAQVGYGDAARLFGVVGKVSLRKHVGVVADDLDGVFVRADRAVRTQTPEFAGGGALGGGVGVFLDLKRQLGHIVLNADGEALLGTGGLHVAHHRNDLGRGGVLGAEAVAAGVDRDVGKGGVAQGGDHVEVKGLAEGAGLLGAVEHADALGRLGQGGQQVLDREGTIEVHLDQADLFALGVEVIDRLFDGLADRAHGDDDLFGVARAVVVEELVFGAELLVDLVHVILGHVDDGIIIFVGGFAVLEEDVGVLRRAALRGMLRIEGAAAEGVDGLPVEHIAQILVIPLFDLLNLMGGTEAVEEMHEGNAALDGGQMGHRAEIHDLLRGIGAEHGKAGLTAGVNVRMVAEDGQRVAGHGAGRNVDDARQKLACNLVHVRDHEKKALGRGVGGGQRARGQRAVNCAGGAGLRLHLGHPYRLTEEVCFAHRSHLIGFFGHVGRRGDGVDRGNVGKGIRYVCGGRVAVHGLGFSCHVFDVLPFGE